ncbi:M15 family metallopeptidase [Aliiroseovarius sp. 2305UL8-7]|uniref:M15 family metallopeptidase n=1 Tax=Aliiroseovarius conchicola TaxID=3121637 RepID=UPI0035273D1E
MTPQELRRRALNCLFPRTNMQVEKRQTSYTYVDGPMMFLGQQIVKVMEDSGYPAKIFQCYRSPARQQELYDQGRTKPGKRVTKAKPFSSAHQYLEAVDIIHPSIGWPKREDPYWEALGLSDVSTRWTDLRI